MYFPIDFRFSNYPHIKGHFYFDVMKKYVFFPYLFVSLFQLHVGVSRTCCSCLWSDLCPPSVYFIKFWLIGFCNGRDQVTAWLRIEWMQLHTINETAAYMWIAANLLLLYGFNRTL